MAAQCQYPDQIKTRHTKKKGCEDCLKMGDTWVHLRLCLTCGHVGCCDSSKNKHATRHFHATDHPLVRSIEPGESWVWCYADEVIAGELQAECRSFLDSGAALAGPPRRGRFLRDFGAIRPSRTA